MRMSSTLGSGRVGFPTLPSDRMRQFYHNAEPWNGYSSISHRIHSVVAANQAQSPLTAAELRQLYHKLSSESADSSRA